MRCDHSGGDTALPAERLIAAIAPTVIERVELPPRRWPLRGSNDNNDPAKKYPA